MITFPNAKINLGLSIVSKREDGYHDIESCFYPIPWQDCLEVLKADYFAFQSYGLPIPGDETSNLCLRAYNLLKNEFDLPPVEIHLLKNIPMGAGLGGGSADGAFTLKMLNEVFRLGLTEARLEIYSLKLGSDCPFFIQNRPAIATGRGELLKPIPLNLSGYFLAIHNPGIHITTREAYAHVQPRKPDVPIETILTSDIQTWKEWLKNDFEDSVFQKHLEIRAIKEEMYAAGALYASMTGSGSTVYGIFEKAISNNHWKWLAL